MNDLITKQPKSDSNVDLFKFRNVFGTNLDNELDSRLENFVSSNGNGNARVRESHSNLNPYDNMSTETSIADLDTAFNNVNNFPLFDTATLTDASNSNQININMMNKELDNNINTASLGSSSSETVYSSTRHMSIESHDLAPEQTKNNKNPSKNNYVNNLNPFNNVNDNNLIGNYLNQTNGANIINDMTLPQTSNMKQSISFEGDASDSSSLFSPSSAMSRAASVSVVEGNLITHQTGNHLSGHINSNSSINMRKGSMYEISKMKEEKPKRIRKAKASHNDIEKKYRLSINDKIVQLRNLVPTIRYGYKEISNIPIDTIDIVSLDGLEPTKKLNKGTILNKTIEYIKHLEAKCNNYKSINEKLLQNMAGSMTQIDNSSVKVKLEENEIDNKFNDDLSPLTDSINNLSTFSNVDNSFKF